MALLTLALEQGKVRFITACVRSWADGGRPLCVGVCVWLLCPVWVQCCCTSTETVQAIRDREGSLGQPPWLSQLWSLSSSQSSGSGCLISQCHGPLFTGVGPKKTKKMVSSAGKKKSPQVGWWSSLEQHCCNCQEVKHIPVTWEHWTLVAEMATSVASLWEFQHIPAAQEQCASVYLKWFHPP